VLVTVVREGSFAVFSVTVSSIMDSEVDVFTFDEDIHLRFSLFCCWETVGLDVD